MRPGAGAVTAAQRGMRTAPPLRTEGGTGNKLGVPIDCTKSMGPKLSSAQVNAGTIKHRRDTQSRANRHDSLRSIIHFIQTFGLYERIYSFSVTRTYYVTR